MELILLTFPLNYQIVSDDQPFQDGDMLQETG